MKILMTAFDPFGGATLNPALEAVKRLPEKIFQAEIIKLEVPTVFGKSASLLKTAIAKFQPDVVINVGQAGGRACVTLERVAINLDDARIPDNEGNQPIDTPIKQDGAPAYFATLPIKAMVAEIKAAGFPSTVSNTAGTFVCNHLMYQTLYLAEKSYPQLKAGFIHVPFIPQQVINQPQQPFMSLEDITKSLEKAIEALLHFTDREDLKISEGTTH